MRWGGGGRRWPVASSTRCLVCLVTRQLTGNDPAAPRRSHQFPSNVTAEGLHRAVSDPIWLVEAAFADVVLEARDDSLHLIRALGEIKVLAIVDPCGGVVHAEALVVLGREVEEGDAGALHQRNPRVWVVLLGRPGLVLMPVPAEERLVALRP